MSELSQVDMESWDTYWQGPYWDGYTYSYGTLAEPSGYVNTGSRRVGVGPSNQSGMMPVLMSGENCSSIQPDWRNLRTTPRRLA